MRSVNLQLGLNSFWQEREGGEGRLRLARAHRCPAPVGSEPESGAGQDPSSSPVPGGQRGSVGAVPRWGAGQGMGNQEPAPGHQSRQVWDPPFQLCPVPLTPVRSLPGGSVRPTDP